MSDQGQPSQTTQTGLDSTDIPEEVLVPVMAGPPPSHLRVGWISAPRTLELYGRAIQPLAIGLIDELVDIVALCPDRVDAQELPSPPIEIIRYGRTHLLGFPTRVVDSLAEELASRRIQLLHALDVEAWPLTARLARMTGLPAVVSSYSLDDARRLKGAGKSAAVILAASEPVRQNLLLHLAARGRVELLRPGIYQARSATCFLDPAYCISIVAGGDLDNFAAFNAVIKSFAHLRDRKYDCVFFVIGNGRAEKQLRASAERLGIRHELTFVDRQPARLLPGIFKAADIYISPVASRSLDMPCLLAMAGGIPVLATANGASDFLAGDGIATRFKQGSAADLTAKLNDLMVNHVAAKEIAEKALAILRENHSPARMVSALAQIYRQTAKV